MTIRRSLVLLLVALTFSACGVGDDVEVRVFGVSPDRRQLFVESQSSVSAEQLEPRLASLAMPFRIEVSWLVDTRDGSTEMKKSYRVESRDGQNLLLDEDADDKVIVKVEKEAGSEEFYEAASKALAGSINMIQEAMATRANK